jgi:hypothetical protein
MKFTRSADHSPEYGPLIERLIFAYVAGVGIFAAFRIVAISRQDLPSNANSKMRRTFSAAGSSMTIAFFWVGCFL